MSQFFVRVLLTARKKRLYLFHVFVPQEKHIGVIFFRPGIQDGIKVRRPQHCTKTQSLNRNVIDPDSYQLTLVFHEILGKLFHIAGKSAQLDELVEIEKRYQGVFRVSRYVNHL